MNLGNASRRRLGELLVENGALTAEMLQRALSAQTHAGGSVRLGGILVGGGVLPEKSLLETLARIHRCDYVGWEELSQADPAAFKLLPSARAYKLGAFPFAIQKRVLRVAFTNPSNLAAFDEVAALTNCRIEPAVTSEMRLMQAHEKFYGRSIGQPFSTLLNRLNRPRAAASKPGPLVVPPPPRFDGPDSAPAPASGAAASASTPQEGPPGTIPIKTEYDAGSLPDPFSDGYSLSEFVADALAFGVPARELFEGRSAESLLASRLRVEEEPLSLGEPLAAGEDLDETRPSRRRPRGPGGAGPASRA